MFVVVVVNVIVVVVDVVVVVVNVVFVALIVVTDHIDVNKCLSEAPEGQSRVSVVGVGIKTWRSSTTGTYCNRIGRSVHISICCCKL